jgi:hypothetical protein
MIWPGWRAIATRIKSKPAVIWLVGSWHPRRRKTDGDSSPRHFFRMVAEWGWRDPGCCFFNRSLTLSDPSV